MSVYVVYVGKIWGTLQMCVHVFCMCTCVHVCMCVYMCVYVCMCLHVCICVCMCEYVCTCLLCMCMEHVHNCYTMVKCALYGTITRYLLLLDVGLQFQGTPTAIDG